MDPKFLPPLSLKLPLSTRPFPISPLTGKAEDAGQFIHAA